MELSVEVNTVLPNVTQTISIEDVFQNLQRFGTIQKNDFGWRE
jgi:hypothetical protein